LRPKKIFTEKRVLIWFSMAVSSFVRHPQTLKGTSFSFEYVELRALWCLFRIQFLFLLGNFTSVSFTHNTPVESNHLETLSAWFHMILCTNSLFLLDLHKIVHVFRGSSYCQEILMCKVV
jgi:hypothetical protein